MPYIHVIFARAHTGLKMHYDIIIFKRFGVEIGTELFEVDRLHLTNHYGTGKLRGQLYHQELKKKKIKIRIND